MKCKNCGNEMARVTPESGEIKIQMKCRCGRVETIKHAHRKSGKK